MVVSGRLIASVPIYRLSINYIFCYCPWIPTAHPSDTSNRHVCDVAVGIAAAHRVSGLHLIVAFPRRCQLGCMDIYDGVERLSDFPRIAL